MVGEYFLWPALRYGTGYHTVWEIRPSAETPSSVHWRRFYFQLTRVHSTLELFGRCTLQIYLLTYLLILAWSNSVPNFSKIDHSAAELWRSQQLTLCPWTCATCCATFHTVSSHLTLFSPNHNNIILLEILTNSGQSIPENFFSKFLGASLGFWMMLHIRNTARCW